MARATERPTDRARKQMLAPCSRCPASLCALQPQASKPQRGVTLSAPLCRFSSIQPPPDAHTLTRTHWSVYLFGGITVNPHLSNAACRGWLVCPRHFCACRIVCARARANMTKIVCVIRRTTVFVCLCVSVTGILFLTVLLLLSAWFWYFGTDGTSFLSATACSVDVFGSRIKTGGATQAVFVAETADWGRIAGNASAWDQFSFDNAFYCPLLPQMGGSIKV